MRRSVLLTLATLGALVSVVGGMGLFAALSDTAVTGTNSAESPGLAASADIQIATGTPIQPPIGSPGPVTLGCGTFSDDLATGLFNVADVPVGYQSPDYSYVCVQNVGSQAVTLSIDATEVTDVDVSCSGDEALNGDTTCGNSQLGELSGVLATQLTEFPMCDLNVPAQIFQVNLSGGGGLDTLPAQPLGTLSAGAPPRCFGFKIVYPASTPALDVQKAQSDKVTWRFRFNAQAA